MSNLKQKKVHLTVHHILPKISASMEKSPVEDEEIEIFGNWPEISISV